MDQLETISLIVILMFILDDMLVHRLLDQERDCSRDDDATSQSTLEHVLHD